MEINYKNSIVMIMISFIVIVLCSGSMSAQVKFNQHNTYVTNSEIHHLRKMGIDLFTQPYTDPTFQKNVRLTLKQSNEYKDEKAKYAALGVSSLLGILVGVAGLIVDQDESATIVNGSGQSVSQTSIKSQYILLGAAGAITAGFALKARKKRNESKSVYEQQLQITKDQYSLLR